MLLYGASGHGKVIIDSLESQNIEIKGIFDDDLSKKELIGYPVIGKYKEHYLENNSVIISIGDNRIRKNISEIVKHPFRTAIHKSASIAKNVEIGAGSVVFHNSVLQSSVVIGKHVIINTAASVDHDCVIGDYAHISPNATLCGSVRVGEGTHVGAGAVIIPNITIGKWVMVGAGSVVTKDVPNYSIIVGNPGRIIKRSNERSSF